MINPKNKRVQVTLPGETAELLESLSIRYHKTNSEIVKWAINVLAARKRHNIVIKLREQNDSSDQEQEFKNEEYYAQLRKRFEDESQNEINKILNDENLTDDEKDKLLMEKI